MAYATLFKNTFNDWEGTGWETLIQERDFGGSLTEVNCAGVPFSIRWSGGDVLKGSECIINLVSESDFQFTALFASDEKKYKVIINRNTGGGLTLFWSGFILPGQYSEPLIHIPYFVTVTASDQIGLLNNFQYANSTTDVPYDGDETALIAITKCLEYTGLGLDIHSGVNLYETNMNQTASDDPLFQTVLNQDVWLGDFKQYSIIVGLDKDGNPINKFFGGNCKTVLGNIIETYEAKIFQWNGTWWILRDRELYETFFYRVYNSAGVYQSDTSLNPALSLTSGSAGSPIVYILQQQVLEIIQAYKKIDIIQDWGYKENLVLGGSFQQWEFLSDVSFRHWGVFTWPGANVTKYNDIMLERVQRGFIDGFPNTQVKNIFLKLNGNDPTFSGAPNFAQYIFSEPLTVENSSQLSVFVNFDVFIDPDDVDNEGIVFMQLVINAGGGSYYTWDGSAWQNTSTFSVKFANLTSGSWNRISFDTDIQNLPAAGDLNVRFFRLANTSAGQYYYLDNVRVQLAYPRSGGEFVQKSIYNDEINPNSTLDMPQKTIILSDAPAAMNDNKRTVFYGTLGRGTVASNVATALWENVIGGVAQNENIPIINHLKDNIEALRSDSINRISCVILEVASNTMAMTSTIKDPKNGNKIFVWSDVEYFPRSNMWDGTMKEIKDYSSSGDKKRITEDGDQRITEDGDDRIIE